MTMTGLLKDADAMRPHVLVSLHDVTPFHLPRLRRVESLFAELGIKRAAYLFIPDYHTGNPATEDQEFLSWCRAPRVHAVEWLLHGYYHLETTSLPGSQDTGAFDRLRLILLTGGEGEFLRISAAEQRHRIEKGRAVFETCLNHRPTGFVAPAFLYGPELLPLLAELGFDYTENHRMLFRLDLGRQLRAPVVTWATRTLTRKLGSIAAAPLLARLWAREPVLRVAIHPFDFDHPETVANIRRVLSQALSERRQILPAQLDFEAASLIRAA
jgi:predicted deacetylase